MAMQNEQSCHKSDTTSSKQGRGKQPTSASSVHCNSDDRRVRTASRTQTCVSRANLLPSKFDKAPCRPLPPLQGTALMVQGADSRTSLKPAKSSGCCSQPTIPVKGQHIVLPLPTQNSGVSVTGVHTAADGETQCAESKHVASVGSAKDTSKNNKSSPAQLRRSRSVSRLSGSSSSFSSAGSSKLSHSPFELSNTRQSRSATSRNAGQHAGVKKSAHTITIGQNSDEIHSASNGNQRAAAHSRRRRSSSVSSSARDSLQELNQTLTSSPLSLGQDFTPCSADRETAVKKSAHTITIGQDSDEIHSASNGSQRATARSSRRRRSGSVSSSAGDSLQELNQTSSSSPLSLGQDSRVPDAGVSGVLEGNQWRNFAIENSSKTLDKDGKTESENDAKELQSTTVREQDGAVSHLQKEKPLKKSSSSHGILGGKSDEEVPEPAKSFISAESQQNSVVCTHSFLFTSAKEDM